MKEDNRHIDHLISRYLTGEASRQEQEELKSWIDASEVHRKYFNDIRWVHQEAVPSQPLIRVNVDRAWDNVRSKMHRTPETTVIHPTSPWIIWGRIAALLIIVLGISYLIYSNLKPTAGKSLTVTTFDSTSSHTFTDHSQAYLNRHTTLSWASDYGKKQRMIDLSGEAYFNVEHNRNKPFIVEAEGTRIKDLGTAFNVKAYAGDTIVEVFVDNGSVAFYTEENPGISLSGGEKGIYNKRSHLFVKSSEVEPNILAYKTKTFVFRDTPLSEVVRELGAVYGIKIILDNQALMHCKITVTFAHENMETIIGIISETFHLQYARTADGYVLMGNGCDAQSQYSP